MSALGEGLTLNVPDEVVSAIAERAAALVTANINASAETWVGVERAAEHLACRKQRIYDLVSQKDSGIPYRKEGARLLFRLSELDGWLDTHVDLGQV